MYRWLISWNVNGCRGPKPGRQIAAAAERPADVVALREIRAEILPAVGHGVAGGRPAARPRQLRPHRRRVAERPRVPADLFQPDRVALALRRLPALRLELPERYLAVTVEREGVPFEVHNAHLPPGSTRGLVKLEMFEAPGALPCVQSPVRREALVDRVEVRDLDRGSVAAGLRSWGSLSREVPGRVGAALTKPWRVGTARRRGCGERDGKAYARNRRSTPLNDAPARTWRIWAGGDAHPPPSSRRRGTSRTVGVRMGRPW